MKSIRMTLMAIAWLPLYMTPVLAEVDLSGNWGSRNHEDFLDRMPGPDMVDYTGIPLSDAARSRALSYTTDVLSIPQRQCLMYPPYYLLFDPRGVKIWTDTDPITGAITAWNISAGLDTNELKIWMDDRPHPGPEALHPDGGFMTGKWEGDTLVVYATHMKESFFRRNGVPGSDQLTMTLYITRHADLLSITGIIEDPIYLTEPYVVSKIFKSQLWGRQGLYPSCSRAEELPGLSHYEVPSYLPGQNPQLHNMTEKYNIPLDAAMGGAKTMYPEYQQKITDDGYRPPAAYCKYYCCGWGGPFRNETTLLQCKLEVL